MSDLIDKHAAIDALIRKMGPHDNGDGTMTIYVMSEELVRETLNALPFAQPERWIPVSERLPEVRQWVLCQCRAGRMDVLRLTTDGSWDKNYPHTEYMNGFVVAWKPLPEPYEVEQCKD